MPSDIYGKVEVAWFQLTPMGTDAITNPARRRNLDAGAKKLLNDFAQYDGTMEWDEIKLTSVPNAPNAAGVALRRLIDLGYVRPVKFEDK